jgi:hypothetical protein
MPTPRFIQTKSVTFTLLRGTSLRVVFRLLPQRRGLAGNSLGTTIKKLLGAASIGLGTTAKYL